MMSQNVVMMGACFPGWMDFMDFKGYTAHAECTTGRYLPARRASAARSCMPTTSSDADPPPGRRCVSLPPGPNRACSACAMENMSALLGSFGLARVP